jgi:AraC-like DNA-binding protein
MPCARDDGARVVADTVDGRAPSGLPHAGHGEVRDDDAATGALGEVEARPPCAGADIEQMVVRTERERVEQQAGLSHSGEAVVPIVAADRIDLDLPVAVEDRALVARVVRRPPLLLVARRHEQEYLAPWSTDGVGQQSLSNLALLRRVRDRIDRDYAQPLDVEALARGVNMSAGHLSREFKIAYGEAPYSYLMTRRIERAMALLRRGDMSVTEVCFAVGCSSLGTFSTRFTELVGVSPSAYRREPTSPMAGMPACVTKQVSRPVRNREARVAESRLA